VRNLGGGKKAVPPLNCVHVQMLMIQLASKYLCIHMRSQKDLPAPNLISAI
jgi:hypothetical protein